ncbi:TonB-dependent receptor [Mucilaginibacter mali]|uniref:TonB-dependent receptor n=1 Tax=Mucilaginibacter mali TaxID=2740462 RepID=A0A7D4PSC7_9SPHI|nr:carboxypeptidase-like regulatory domain-containing protein [Mucilaginibacter mali]QKJ28923.1 TonB-dependent receptor [Mucilaginibacter mali]
MKKRTILPLLLATAAFFLLRFTYADGELDKLLTGLEKYTAEYPQEKIHIQFDKPYYSVGEDIWFKAYVVNAEKNILSPQSKILYIDLLDERDSVVQTKVFPLANGMTDANIPLTDSLYNSGNYHLYAYTKWMTNFGTDYYFKKTIPLVNARHGAISGSLTYKAISSAAGKQLNADITFANEKGQPHIAGDITYVLQANGKNIANGKATTDVSGKINIASLLKPEFKNSPVTITTNLITRDKHIITQSFVIKPLAAGADVQFFPEGGTLVNNIRTKVAFKAVKPDGISEAISGYIIDNANERVAEFRSQHAGMGLFALQPLPGKSYTAVVTHEDGTESRYQLPAATENGYVLNVNQTGKDSLSVRVSASPGLINGREAVLVAQINGVVQFAARTKLDGPSNLSIISTKKFPTGIAQFTLFSPDYAPVAERLIFVEHNNRLDAEISTDKPAYAQRGKVKMDMKVTDVYGDPVMGSFSVAVTDESKVKMAEDDELSILSNLLLTSDIKGYIEQPNYYFNAANPDRLKHLDQLLLTQGWRRFNWADLQAGKYPQMKYRPEQGLTVTGTIKTFGNKPVSKGKVVLFASTNNGPLIIDTVADEQGRFVFEGLDFADSAKLVVRAANAKDRGTVKISIDKKPRINFKPGFIVANDVKGFNLNEYLRSTEAQFTELTKLGLMKNVIALKEVQIKAKRDYIAEKTVPHSANLDPGHADIVLKADKFKTVPHFIDAFYNVPGVRVVGKLLFPVGLRSITGQGPMLVIMDGAYLPRNPKLLAEILESIPPGDILAVELLTHGSASMYGNDGASGVVIITTKRGDEQQEYVPELNVGHYTPKGYSSTKSFYAPVYDTPADNRAADLRSTIHWAPNVVTNDKGEASISYFNADGVGIYKVTLEGMDLKGNLARRTYTYAVK